MNFPIHRQYRKDITGLNVENKVINEVIKRPPYGDGSVIIPKHAPFFIDSVQLSFPNGQPLIYGTDYHFLDIDPDLSDYTGQAIGIMIKLKTDVTDFVLADYQTIGSVPIFNRVINGMIDSAVNDIREIWWDDISGKPELFPLEFHVHDLEIDIFALEALNRVLEKRYEMFYKNDQVSLHREFFLTQLSNLKSYVGIIKDEFESLIKKHDVTGSNAHGTRFKDVKGLEQLSNVKTANLKDTMTLSSDNMRLAVNPTVRTIQAKGLRDENFLKLDELRAVEVKRLSGLTEYGVKQLPGVMFDNVSAFMYLDGDNRGHGLISGYDGYKRRLVRLFNPNPLDRFETPYDDTWENLNIVYDDELDTVIRGSNHIKCLVGSTKNKVFHYFKPADDISAKPQLVKLTGTDSWDRALVKHIVLIPTNDDLNLILVYRPNNTNFTLSVYHWFDSDVKNNEVALRSADIAVTGFNGTKDLAKAQINLFTRGFTNGLMNRSLVSVDKPVKLDLVRSTLNAVGVKDRKGMEVKLWFGETWQYGYRTINVPFELSFNVQYQDKQNLGTLVVNQPSKLETINTENLFKVGLNSLPETFSNLPWQIGFDTTSLNVLLDGSVTLLGRLKSPAHLDAIRLPVTSFKGGVQTPDQLRQFDLISSRDLRLARNKEGFVELNESCLLLQNNQDELGNYSSGYSESNDNGGLTVFKTIDRHGDVTYGIKVTPVGLSLKSFEEGPVWTREATNDTHHVTNLSATQPRIAYTETDSNYQFGNTWFTAIHSQQLEGENFICPGGFYFTGQGDFRPSTYYGVNADCDKWFRETLVVGNDGHWELYFPAEQTRMRFCLLFGITKVGNEYITSIASVKFDPSKYETELHGQSPLVVYQRSAFSLIGTVKSFKTPVPIETVYGIETFPKLESLLGNGLVTVVYEHEHKSFNVVWNSSFTVPDDVNFNYRKALSLVIELDETGVITNAGKGVYDGRFNTVLYNKALGWHVTNESNRGTLMGYGITGYSITGNYNTLVGGIADNNIVTTFLTVLSRNHYTVYLTETLNALIGGGNYLVRPVQLNLADYTNDLKTKRFYLYLMVVNKQPVFQIHESTLTEDVGRRILAQITTDDKEITEILPLF